MKLTLKTDYALRVIIYLQNNKKASIKDVAAFYKIKKNHLSVIVNELSKLGYVSSTPGPGGGISLVKSCLEETLSDVVLKFESFELVECFNKQKNNCRLNPTCKLKAIFHTANKAFLSELGKFRLKDLKV